MPVTFNARVKSVQIKETKITVRQIDEDGRSYAATMTVPVGRIVLEFEDVKAVHELAEMIGDMPIVLGLADSQMKLPGAFQ